MGARLIIIRYCCGKQCELLWTDFLHHKLDLLCNLPLSSIIDDKIPPPPPFLPPLQKKSKTPPPPPYPHLLLENSNTDVLTYITIQRSTYSALRKQRARVMLVL